MCLSLVDFVINYLYQKLEKDLCDIYRYSEDRKTIKYLRKNILKKNIHTITIGQNQPCNFDRKEKHFSVHHECADTIININIEDNQVYIDYVLKPLNNTFKRQINNKENKILHNNIISYASIDKIRRNVLFIEKIINILIKQYSLNRKDVVITKSLLLDLLVLKRPTIISFSKRHFNHSYSTTEDSIISFVFGSPNKQLLINWDTNKYELEKKPLYG